MKKILSLAACSAMVLGFAATASAIHIEAPAETSTVVAKGALLTIDGSIRTRGVAETKELKKDQDGTKASYDQRVRLGVNAQASDAVSGYVLLEEGSGTSDVEPWGEDNYLLGSGDTGFEQVANGSLHNGGAKKGGLNILEAWINYKPANWGVKVGHMPLALGNNLFFDHTGSGDDAIVAYLSPSDSTDLGVLTVKFAELSSLATDDLDGYVAYAVQRVSDALKLGANYTYLNIGSAITGSLNGNQALDGAGFSNLGVTIDGNIGGITYGLDGEFQFGDALTSTNGTELDDAGGYALMGTIGMDLGGVKVGALVGYGSGDDDATDTNNDQFLNFLTDTAYQSYFMGYRQAVPGMSGKNTGLANMTLVQLNAGLDTKCPLTGKDLNLKAKVNWAQLNEVPTNADDNLGVEVELFADWQLGNGLVYGVEAAYLFAGDAYATALNATNADDAEDGFFLRHRLELKW